MNTRIQTVSFAQKSSKHQKRPAIRLSGQWLWEFGFAIDSQVVVTYGLGKFSFQLVDDVASYKSYAKKMLQSKAGRFLQVSSVYSNRKKVPSLVLKGNFLAEFGFAIGDVLVVRADFGSLEVVVLDLDKVKLQ